MPMAPVMLHSGRRQWRRERARDGQPIDTKANINAFGQRRRRSAIKPDDARLLGGEQLVPKRLAPARCYERAKCGIVQQ